MPTEGTEPRPAHQSESAWDAEPAPVDGGALETTPDTAEERPQIKENAKPAFEESKTDSGEKAEVKPEPAKDEGKSEEDLLHLSLSEIEDLETQKKEEPEVKPELPTEAKEKADDKGPEHTIKFEGEERKYTTDAVLNMAQQFLHLQRQQGEFKPLLDQARQLGFSSQETAKVTGFGAKMLQTNTQVLQQGIQPGSPEHGQALLAAMGYQVQPGRQQAPQPQQPPIDLGVFAEMDAVFPGAGKYLANLAQENQQLKQGLQQVGGYVQGQTQMQRRQIYNQFSRDMEQGINAADHALNEAEKAFGVQIDPVSRVEFADFARRETGGDPRKLGDPALVRIFVSGRYPDAYNRAVGQRIAAEEAQRRKDAMQASVSGTSAPGGVRPAKQASAWEPDEYSQQAAGS